MALEDDQLDLIADQKGSKNQKQVASSQVTTITEMTHPLNEGTGEVSLDHHKIRLEKKKWVEIGALGSQTVDLRIDLGIKGDQLSCIYTKIPVFWEQVRIF